MSFFLNDDDVELVYKNIRDLDGHCLKARKFIEWLWIKCKKHNLLDSDHQVQAKNQFHDRFWEKYLAITLLNRNLNPNKQGEGYPDFSVSKDNITAHIEAIAPNRGNGSDAVPIMPPNGTVYNLPHNEIHLRLTSSIQKKYTKWLSGYSKRDRVSKKDPFIIAINGRNIHEAITLMDPPAILEVLFAIGPLAVNFDNKHKKAFYKSKPTVQKINNESIYLGHFLNSNYAEISGILYSNLDCVNRPKKMGGDFIYIPNPHAKNKVPFQFFSFCKQYHFKKIDKENFWFDIIPA